ncbi:hypothetical protein FMM72_10210 [Anaerotruncus colihominis]|uniref:Uncharacterized protein n=1 Tax=Anaerotruncus colihominis TaxID=169435 RepID=A0A845T5D7_9FIRM|nr:hypothetical protein [Anaerotruncus colihominis]
MFAAQPVKIPGSAPLFAAQPVKMPGSAPLFAAQPTKVFRRSLFSKRLERSRLKFFGIPFFQKRYEVFCQAFFQKSGGPFFKKAGGLCSRVRSCGRS